MDSRVVLKWHVRVFKICGLWPPEDGSILYNIWVVFFTITVNIGFPVSQLICVLWVDSVNAAVDHLVITSTVIMAVVKGLNVLAKKKTFVELLRLMKELDSTVTPDEYERIFKRKFQLSDGLLLLFCINYIGSWTCVAIQVIMSDPAHRLWSSTYLYPSEFLHQRSIYTGGIIFQAISNLLLVFVDIMVDTYGASLLHILGGHIEILSQRLQALGKDCNTIDDFRQQEPILIELCKKYLLIIRFGSESFIKSEQIVNERLLSPQILEVARENTLFRSLQSVWCERFGFVHLCLSTLSGIFGISKFALEK